MTTNAVTGPGAGAGVCGGFFCWAEAAAVAITVAMQTAKAMEATLSIRLPLVTFRRKPTGRTVVRRRVAIALRDLAVIMTTMSIPPKWMHRCGSIQRRRTHLCANNATADRTLAVRAARTGLFVADNQHGAVGALIWIDKYWARARRH
jgi:hypothetical protein